MLGSTGSTTESATAAAVSLSAFAASAFFAAGFFAGDFFAAVELPVVFFADCPDPADFFAVEAPVDAFFAVDFAAVDFVAVDFVAVDFGFAADLSPIKDATCCSSSLIRSVLVFFCAIISLRINIVLYILSQMRGARKSFERFFTRQCKKFYSSTSQPSYAISMPSGAAFPTMPT